MLLLSICSVHVREAANHSPVYFTGVLPNGRVPCLLPLASKSRTPIPGPTLHLTYVLQHVHSYVPRVHSRQQSATLLTYSYCRNAGVFASGTRRAARWHKRKVARVTACSAWKGSIAAATTPCQCSPICIYICEWGLCVDHD